MSDNLTVNMKWDGVIYPAWYRLSFNTETCTIIFKVAESVLDWFEETKASDYCSSSDLAKLIGLEFVGPENKFWGFNNSIETKVSTEAGWIEYHIGLPKNIEDASFPVITEDGMFKAKAVAASVSQLCLMLNTVREKYLTVSIYKQLIIFQSFLGIGDMAAYQLGAYYSRYISEWGGIENKDGQFEIVHAIDSAETHMFPSTVSTSESYKAQCRNISPCYIAFDCSMHVGMGPTKVLSDNSAFDKGYEVCMDNPDNPYNQLLLIAGLAKLYEIVERHFILTGVFK